MNGATSCAWALRGLASSGKKSYRFVSDIFHIVQLNISRIELATFGQNTRPGSRPGQKLASITQPAYRIVLLSAIGPGEKLGNATNWRAT